ncbi:MAG: nucleotidyltransferase family protein [Alphaproteobacteria bacterium]|nr:nucleotidyltransferase family protein [Alphaproteobacteria bacterium]
MTIRPSRAMIMAAGLGTRMRPLTNDRPKPLIMVDGRTLLDHAIDRLKAVGVNTFVVNVHYKGEMVIDHLKGRSDATFIIQDERDRILDTGGALKRALPHFGREPFFTHNSDSIWLESWGSNLERMIQQWDEHRMDCLMLLAATHSSLGYDGAGDFTMDPEGRLARRQAPRLAPFAWPGVQIIDPRLVARSPAEDVFSTNRLWNIAIEEGRLYGIRLDGKWMHIGTPEAREEAEALLASRRAAP